MLRKAAVVLAIVLALGGSALSIGAFAITVARSAVCLADSRGRDSATCGAAGASTMGPWFTFTN